MIDMKLLRTEPEKVIAALARRKEKVDIEGLLALDKEKREVMYEAEQKKAQQNAVSKKIHEEGGRGYCGCLCGDEAAVR